MASGRLQRRPLVALGARRAHAFPRDTRRVLASRAALPEEISGLTYVSPRAGAAPVPLAEVAAATKTPQKSAASAAPPAGVAVTLGGWPLVATLGLVTVAALSTCGAAFVLVAAPALRAVVRASEAAERAARGAERAMREFETLSAQTLEDLPRTLDEMETAGREWDALARELRELLTRVERWGQFSGADEALTKLTSAVLEEPSRAVATTMDEAESFIKSLTDDFSAAVSSLTDWERRLNETVNQAGFKEAWERDLLDEGKSENLAAVTRAAVAARQRKAVADAIGVAEAATERARAASLALLDDQKKSHVASSPRRGAARADDDESSSMARAMAAQADAVASSLRNALEAVEEAKEAATDVAAFDAGFDEGRAETEAETDEAEAETDDRAETLVETLVETRDAGER